MSIADIVVPVSYGLNAVRDCLDSLISNTRPGSYSLFLIDDHRDRYIREYLNAFSKSRSWVQVVSDMETQRFWNACETGLPPGNAHYLVLLSSDAVLPPNWLPRLIACAEAHPNAVAVRPLSNAGVSPFLPMFPGTSFLSMDAFLCRHFPGKALISTACEIGVCTLLKRASRSPGRVAHSAESDDTVDPENMSFASVSQRAVTACDTYIFQNPDACNLVTADSSPTNRSFFTGRLAEYRRQYRECSGNKPVASIRSCIGWRKRWHPMPVFWQTARSLMSCLKEKRISLLPVLGLEGLLRLPFAYRYLPTARFIHELTQPHRLRVAYVLDKVVIAGGVLSVIQIVNELIRLGIEARIVTFFTDPAIYGWTRLYTEPLVYSNENEMLADFPPTDIAVATLWSTASLVTRLVRNGQARVGAYFIQDYEPWFFPETDEVSRQRVCQTYAMIPNRIVKSRWLAGMLAADGFSTQQILLGMNLGRFYPREVDKSRLVVLSMVRPKTTYRGFAPTIAALAEVKKQIPEVEIVLFGDRFLAGQSIPFTFRDEGVVMDQNKLAELYSEATVFLDGSDFQGFGRCGLEAMACGAACVLTGSGGVTEYAVDGENAMVVPPKNPERFAAAILALLHNPELRSRLIAGGISTARRFCHRREARQTRDYFLSLTGQDGCCTTPEENSR